MTERQHANEPGTALIERASALLDLGRAEQAIPLLAQAIGADPDDPVGYLMMTRAQMLAGDLEQARSYAGRALAMQPDHDVAHLLMAHLLLQRNDVDAALEHARAAAALDADDGANLTVLAMAEFRSGHSREALDAARHAVRLEPDDADLHELLGDLTLSIEHRPEKSLEHYRIALSLNPEDPGIHHSLATALAACHVDAEALTHYYEAVRLAPGNAAFRDALLDHLHHEVEARGPREREDLWRQVPEGVRSFYEDALSRRGWSGRLRLGTVIAGWLAVILVVTALMSLATGGETRQLTSLALLVLLVLVGLRVLDRGHRWWVGRRNRAAGREPPA